MPARLRFLWLSVIARLPWTVYGAFAWDDASLDRAIKRGAMTILLGPAIYQHHVFPAGISLYGQRVRGQQVHYGGR